MIIFWMSLLTFKKSALLLHIYIIYISKQLWNNNLWSIQEDVEQYLKFKLQKMQSGICSIFN